MTKQHGTKVTQFPKMLFHSQKARYWTPSVKPIPPARPYSHSTLDSLGLSTMWLDDAETPAFVDALFISFTLLLDKMAFWDGQLAARAAARVVEIEESSLGSVITSSDIPAEARVAAVLPVFDLKKRIAMARIRGFDESQTQANVQEILAFRRPRERACIKHEA